uniref:Retrovirus-related Pol polyprotein from transposon TNT 1-94 n=1 Tax=Tanacetum cinerariifolium TaxID=118510 RepID=A0A699GUP3_TANCI|nr:retrovirus-related Pol polyprotein from transposon TNT 1-94 [Tanacetum cinerariifolium]
MLSLAKNVAYNVVCEKTTYGLIKALSNMYEKPSMSNKVFLIRQLVNTKMKEGASIADHVNEFNSILSRLVSVDIKFDDEVQALLLLSSLPESWSCTVTACSKPIASKDKEVHLAVRDYSDTLNCCIEITIDDPIMDFATSFHATYCKEELERFRLRFSKDVRYIPCLKRMLISHGQFDKEGCHVGFEDQQWKVTKDSLVVARRNKRGSIYMVEADPATMLPLSMTTARSREFIEYCGENGIRMLKTVPKTHQHNGVAERMNQTLNERAKRFRIPEEEWQGKEVSLAHLKVFGYESYVKVKYVARYTLDAKSKKCTFIGYGSDEMGCRFWDSKGHKVIQNTNVTFNEDSLYGAKAATDSSNLTKQNQKDQSPCGSSDTSEESKNNRSFENNGKSDDEDFEDGSSFEEGGSETPWVWTSSRDSKAPLRASWCLELKKSIMATKEQLDVKTALLHGDLDEDIYMAQPEGFQPARKKENLVWKVLDKFNMKDAKARCQPLGESFKLNKASRRRIAKVPYASAVGSVIGKEVVLEGISDSDYGGCLDSGKSTTSYVFRVSGTTVSWMSRIQKCVTMPTTKAEYIAIAQADKELSAIHLAKNPMFYSRTKHIKIRYHYIRKQATICFSGKEVVLEGFSDSDYGGCLDLGKSTTSYVFTVSGTTISWMSRIQKCVTMQTTEAEYIAIAQADKELSNETHHDKISLHPKTETYPNLFTMKIHHGGRFSDLPRRKYVNGEVAFVDLMDIDQYDIDTQPRPSNNSGHQNNKGEDEAADEEYNDEADDEDGGEDDEAEDGGQSEEEDNADDEDKYVEDIIDEEHIVDEVEVQMNGFKFEIEGEYVDQMQPKLNMTKTDLEMLDFDSFKSDVEDAKESFAIRDLIKEMVRAHGVETRRSIMIVKNDKFRIMVKCFGVVPLIVKITKEMIMNRGKEIKKDMKILDQGKNVEGNTKEIAKGKKVNVHDKRKGKMNGFRASRRELLGLDKAFIKRIRIKLLMDLILDLPRLVLSIVASENLHLEQLDVKTALLHGDLGEDIYMAQPEGFQPASKKENLVSIAQAGKELVWLKNFLKELDRAQTESVLYCDRECYSSREESNVLQSNETHQDKISLHLKTGKKKDGYDTHSLLEQWTKSYENDDYGYDPYDDYMYEGQDIPDRLQAIFDKLDITIHLGGRFSDLPRRKYVDGEVAFVDLIDIDQCKTDIFDIDIRDEGEDGAADEEYNDEADDEDGGKGEDYEANYEGESKDDEAEDDKDESKDDEAENGGQSEEEDDADDEDKYVEDIIDDEHIVDEVEVQMNGFKIEIKGVDANNSIYPVAYGIVESESSYSWTWFLTCLGDYLDLFSNSNFTFIIDRQKGLLPAIAKLFSTCIVAAIYVFNDLVLIRDSPIIPALEYVREYLMKRIVIVQKRVCSCRKWVISGIPCMHVVACIHDMANNGMVFPTSATRTQAGTQDASQSASQAGGYVIGSQAPATVSQMRRTKKSSTRLIPTK